MDKLEVMTLNQMDSIDQSAVAIIGMAGRFPGAINVDELWNNVKSGLESITFFPMKSYCQPEFLPIFLTIPTM